MPTVQTNGIEMHYEVQGEGEPLLCIMGITAPGEVWEEHVKEWSKHYQCLTPDNRGVGNTDKPEGDYSSAQMADDYAGLLDALGIESVKVVGCSMGSIITQQLALRHPQKVKKAVLMCSWARCDAYAKSVFNHLKTLKAKVTPAEFMEYIQLLIFAKKSWDDEETYQSLLEGRQAAMENENPQPLHGLEGQAAACITHDVYDQLGKIKQPCLVIGGEDDQFTPRWMAEEIHAALPESTLHLYPQSGHAFHWENLADFNQRVLSFLAD
ncbi:alpha/beta fold hydrolase [Roseibacillus ishigakijimensis]|uniref:Alpha/beta hydrolase n=1 Tax=Roseibacillus ishigakijimensis TaxID=454146 RepID=A0A934RPJ0_9BACT|nr:alpha/beta hydrolase [Roseibacillus ishigakijimensis]MBK1834593.1 alpha/beta hydrolase [Roseibacillus ishigakijimensis]